MAHPDASLDEALDDLGALGRWTESADDLGQGVLLGVFIRLHAAARGSSGCDCAISVTIQPTNSPARHTQILHGAAALYGMTAPVYTENTIYIILLMLSEVQVACWALRWPSSSDNFG